MFSNLISKSRPNTNTKPESISDLVSDSDSVSDSDYIQPPSPYTPKTRGRLIEEKYLSLPTVCCESSYIPAKYGNPVYDGTCKKCGAFYQIKTTNQKYAKNQVSVTRASLEGTLNTKLSIIKIQVDNLGNIIGGYVFIPQCDIGYEHISDNVWGQPIVRTLTTTKINKINRITINELNRKILETNKHKIIYENTIKVTLRPRKLAF